MKKSYTVGGKPGLVIPIKPIITLADFSTALGEESFNGEGIDFKTLTKTEAIRILKNRIEFHGRQGSYQGLEDIGEHQETLNAEIEKANEWVSTNYPYLTTTNKTNQ